MDGPAVESLIACQPSVASTCSEENHSRRYCVAEVPKRKVASAISEPVAGRHPTQARQTGELARAQVPRVGRGGVDQRRDQPGDAAQLGLERRKCSRVRRRELGELASRAREIVVKQQRRAVGAQIERRPGRIDGDAALHEPQVPPDRLAQHAEHVGAGGGAEARARTPPSPRSRRRSRAAPGPGFGARPTRDRTRRRARCDRRRRSRRPSRAGAGAVYAHDSSCRILVRR